MENQLLFFLLTVYLHHINKKIGIFDLDLTNPCLDVIFNASDAKFEEHNGIIPPTLFDNIKFLSINQFIKPEELLPLRGNEIAQIILELLTITKWERIGLFTHRYSTYYYGYFP